MLSRVVKIAVFIFEITQGEQSESAGTGSGMGISKPHQRNMIVWRRVFPVTIGKRVQGLRGSHQRTGSHKRNDGAQAGKVHGPSVLTHAVRCSADSTLQRQQSGCAVIPLAQDSRRPITL